MNQNNVNNGRSNGNGSSPDSEKARKLTAPWLTQEAARIYAAQIAQDAFTNSARQTAGSNYGGGPFLYPSYTAPSIYSPGASQAQVSTTDGVYQPHMLAGNHSMQHQVALAAAAVRAYSGNSPLLNSGQSPNQQSIGIPIQNIRSRLRPTNTTTSTSIGQRYLSPRLHTVSSQNEHTVRRSCSMSTLQSNRSQSSPMSSPTPIHPAPPLPHNPHRQQTPPISKQTNSQVHYPDHFRHGSVIRLASGTLKRVEELKTQDFLDSGKISDDLCIDNSTVVKMDNAYSTDTAQLGFSVGSDHIMVTVEATLEHPFFVFGRGWSSCSPIKTLTRYNLVCHQLEVGDICISLTHKESSNNEQLSNNSMDNTDITEKHDLEEPVKVESISPLSPEHSSSSATVTRTPSPINAYKSSNIDSDNEAESPVLDKKRKTCE